MCSVKKGEEERELKEDVEEEGARVTAAGVEVCEKLLKCSPLTWGKGKVSSSFFGFSFPPTP